MSFSGKVKKLMNCESLFLGDKFFQNNYFTIIYYSVRIPHQRVLTILKYSIAIRDKIESKTGAMSSTSVKIVIKKTEIQKIIQNI